MKKIIESFKIKKIALNRSIKESRTPITSKEVRKSLMSRFDALDLERTVDDPSGQALLIAQWVGGFETKFYPDRIEGSAPSSVKRMLKVVMIDLGIKKAKIEYEKGF
jgi:hypothetical protein